jgi:hypothetical protein
MLLREGGERGTEDFLHLSRWLTWRAHAHALLPRRSDATTGWPQRAPAVRGAGRLRAVRGRALIPMKPTRQNVPQRRQLQPLCLHVALAPAATRHARAVGQERRSSGLLLGGSHLGCPARTAGRLAGSAMGYARMSSRSYVTATGPPAASSTWDAVSASGYCATVAGAPLERPPSEEKGQSCASCAHTQKGAADHSCALAPSPERLECLLPDGALPQQCGAACAAGRSLAKDARLAQPAPAQAG